MTARPAPPVPTRVVITGSGGFIGRALALRFAELGAQVIGVDLAAQRPAPGLTPVRGSTLAPAGWRSHLAGAGLVIHTAALVSTVAPLRQAWQVNVLATSRVLDAAVEAGVPRLVFLSSIAVWGEDFPDGVTEDHPAVVQGKSYADTKINGESVVLQAHAAGRIATTVVRPGDVYGPGSRPWVLLPLELIRRGMFVLPDGGRGLFAPTYLDNLVDGIVLAATADSAAGQVLTITDGLAPTCADYFGRLAAMAGGRIRTGPTRPVVALMATAGALERAVGRPSELSANAAGMMLRRGTYSIAKARALIGYEPLVGLDEGMARTREWLSAEGLIAQGRSTQ